MFGRIAIVALLWLGGELAIAQETARGVVFDDRNRNGSRDPEEPGVPGVCVSNGRDVVSTDPTGEWSLSADDDCAFFLIKPSGWGVPVNADQIPQYYYLHKPKGSPTSKVRGVAPTGPLPHSIDFPLFKQKEPDRFDVLLFGDTQARGIREVDFVTHDVVEECIGMEVAFGISLGDIVADDPNLFAEINQSIAQIGVPWYNTFGNHDNDRDATSNEYRDEAFERFYGPSTYAFEYAQVAFICLNDMYFGEDGKYRGHLTEDQLAFVKNYLANVSPDRLVVLYMHVPLLRNESAAALFDLLKDRPHTFSIAAHTHTQFHAFLGPEQGWQGVEPHHHFVSATVSGSWWCGAFDELGIPHATMNDGAPNGYSVITFDGAKYSIRFKAARRPDDYQMNMYLPSEIAAADAERTEILVNVFAGSDRSRVEMRFGRDGNWTPLEQTTTIDPACLAMHELSPYLDQEVLGKKLDTVFGWKMDYPSKTSHMWTGRLPANPAPGTHTVFVRTTDMFGQEWRDERIIRIRP